MSPPSPPTSGFAMAKQMTVGVESQELSTQDRAAKSCDHYGDDKSLNSSLGLLSSHLPAVETLAKLRQRKKVEQSHRTTSQPTVPLPLPIIYKF